MTETCNAIITDTFLGFEDHGIFTVYLTINDGTGTQSTCARCLGSKDRLPTSDQMEVLNRLVRSMLIVLETSSWNNLIGVHCRIKRDKGLITEIGHIINNNWMIL